MTITETRTPATETAPLSSDIGLLALRVVFGGYMAAHGAQKLFGWFDGNGWSNTADSFGAMGYNPGALFGPLAGLSELVGGLLLLFGFATPLAGAIVLGTMINALYVTYEAGLVKGQGAEVAILFGAAAVAIAFTGPGRFSLDHGRPWQRQTTAVAAGALAIGVAAALVTLVLKTTL